MTLLMIWVLLHGPKGHDILLNRDAIVSMQASTQAMTGQPNEHVPGEVRCVINTSDGKFIAVVEPCDEVRRLIEQRK